MYSTKEMAKKLNVSIQTLRNWDKNGVLKADRTPTGRLIYSQEQFLAFTKQTKYIPTSVLDNSVVLITGSGTLATCAIDTLKDRCRKIIVFSRDEHKHLKLRTQFVGQENIRYIIGDILDKDRLCGAMRGVDIVIHTAALKMIETGFYSADAVVRVNTVGTMNVAEAAIQSGVKIALFISSDKACSPMNGLTYGLSKALAESAWISYNNYSTREGTRLCASRYGNIINSNNSFFHTIEAQKKSGQIKITDPDMHRFYFKIQEAMALNIHAIENTLGGEIFIPKLKSASVLDFIQAFGGNYPVITTGLRGVEKIAEEMIAQYEMPYTYASGKDYYKIIPPYISELGMGWDKNRPKEKPIKPFLYTSNSKDVERLSVEDLKDMVK